MNCPSGAGREVIRILVADSNQTQSQLLASALRRQLGLRVTCCRGALADCLHALQDSAVDLVLLGDGHTDTENLIQTLRAICIQHGDADPPASVLADHGRDLYDEAAQSGKEGASHQR